LREILEVTAKIIESSEEELCEAGFFSALTTEECKAIFDAVSDKYPLWLVKEKLRKQPPTVDFGQISAFKNPDWETFQQFFRRMFVYMCDRAYTNCRKRSGKNNKNAKWLRCAWDTFYLQPQILGLGLGHQYDLPRIPAGRVVRGFAML
jgi:hypothetical protein